MKAFSTPNNARHRRNSQLINHIKQVRINVKPQTHKEVKHHEEPAAAREVFLFVYFLYYVARLLIFSIDLQLLLAETDKKYDSAIDNTIPEYDKNAKATHVYHCSINRNCV